MVQISKDETRKIYYSEITFDSIVDFLTRIQVFEEKYHSASIQLELDNGTCYSFTSASEAVDSKELGDLRNKRVTNFILSIYPELSINVANKGYSRLNYKSGDPNAVALVQLAVDCLNLNFDRPFLVKLADNNFVSVFSLGIPVFLLYHQLEHLPQLLYPMVGLIVLLNLALPYLIIKYERGNKIIMHNSKDSVWHRHKESIVISILIGAIFFIIGRVSN